MVLKQKIEKKIVSIRLPKVIHEKVLQEVENRFCTITSYVIRALLEQLVRDEQYK